jgi:predicted nucleotidyltransferase
MQTPVQKQLAQLALRTPNIEVLWLYGSQAKGNAEEGSDWDLAVALKGRDELADDYCDALAHEWSNAIVQKLSLVDINAIPTPLALNIIQDGVVLYSNSDLRQHSEEQRIWSLWEEYERAFKQANQGMR